MKYRITGEAYPYDQGQEGFGITDTIEIEAISEYDAMAQFAISWQKNHPQDRLNFSKIKIEEVHDPVEMATMNNLASLIDQVSAMVQWTRKADTRLMALDMMTTKLMQMVDSLNDTIIELHEGTEDIGEITSNDITISDLKKLSE